MGIKIYNTLTRKKEPFIPLDKKRVKMYVCGPTVYNYISIGNARPVIVFNMVRNYLEYNGYKVDFVQNITDIEDKIINKANDEGVDFNVITKRYIKAFLEDMKNIQVNNFTAMPRASEMIEEIIAIIQKIIDNGYAYVSGGDVYFDVLKFKSYGKLSGIKIEDLKTQEEDNFSKKNRIDFAIWKSAKPGEPYWESPWGKGRPGWHIECSAMSTGHLDYCLDIHGGGIDLVFPHHENEIAQSEAAFPQKGDFVKYWMHNGMIEVKSEKMSKSAGLKDDWILRNLLKKYSADVIKMYMLSTHYRSPLEFSKEKMTEAKKAVERILNFLRNAEFLVEINHKEELAGHQKPETGKIPANEISSRIYNYLKDYENDFKLSMDDDFNSARAIGIVFDFIGNINSIIQKPDFMLEASTAESLKAACKTLRKHLEIFGFTLSDSVKEIIPEQNKHDRKYPSDAEIASLIEQRNLARREKDFSKADNIRKMLKSFNIILEDRKEGTIWKRED